MAYDESCDRIVLYGGNTTPSLMGDTWEFDGLEWQLISQTDPIRMFASMAYDARRQCVLRLGSAPSSPEQVVNESVRWATNSQPEISQHPIDVNAQVGSMVSFAVSAQPLPLDYQWLRGGIPWTTVPLRELLMVVSLSTTSSIIFGAGDISADLDDGTSTGQPSELATQAANGTFSTTQRSALNHEYQALVQEFGCLGETATFNGMSLLRGGLNGSDLHLQAGISGSSNSQTIDQLHQYSLDGCGS